MRRIFLFLSISSIILFITVMACQYLGWGICSSVTDNALYLGSGAIHLGLFSLAMFFLWKNDLRSTLEPIGFPGKPVPVILASIGCLIAIFAVLFSLGAASILLGFNDQQKVSDKITDLPLFVLIFAALGAPITEELFFRGFMYNACRKYVGIFWATLISAAAFAGLHAHAVGFFPIMVLGILLAYLYEKTGTLVSSITVHMIHNLGMVGMVFLVKRLGIY